MRLLHAWLPLLAAALLPSIAAASPVPYATVAVASGAVGTDSTLAVSGGMRIRITAAGNAAIAGAVAGCAPIVGPRGCASDASVEPRPLAWAPLGSLIATFLDRTGTPVTSWFFVGEAGIVVAPPGAQRLVFRTNAAAGRLSTGTFTVTAAAVEGVDPLRAPSAPAARQSQTVRAPRNPLGMRRLTPVGRAYPFDGPAGRPAIAHVVRRLTFGASPAAVTAVASRGVAAWLDTQLAPASIDDSAAASAIEPKPTTTRADGSLFDELVYERRLIERQIATARQVQEKLVLHWLEHFSVGVQKVGDAAMMSHYEDTLRADALGNFKTLLADVTKEPAMLYWLDANGNNAADPANLPNENYARELMQLFTFGTDKLNPDGTKILDAGGRTVPNYAQSDVTSVAAALSGLNVLVDYTGGKDPNTRFSVVFDPSAHPAKQRTLLGTTYSDPSAPGCVEAALDILARHPSTAPFEVKELLQRFVTPAPSARYVAALAAIWSANVDAPDQIARVVRAMVTDPEFNAGYRMQTKEPVELTIGLMRALPATIKGSTNAPPVSDIAGPSGYLGSEHQQLYAPPSVFSFYRPGHKETLLSQQTLLARFAALGAHIGNDAADPATTNAIDTSRLAASIASSDPGRVADYLLDALVDGGDAALRATLLTYLQNGTDDQHLRGAVWLIATSPLYEVN